MKATNTTNTNTHEEDMTMTTTLTRANKLTVKVNAEGRLVADMYRTHKHLITIYADETGFKGDENSTKSAVREDFRKYIAENAHAFGIDYDPVDRRTEQNVRKAVYKTQAEVCEDATAMIYDDITTFMTKMPHAHLVTEWSLVIDTLTPKTTTSKGTSLSTMGIEEGTYRSSGNLAWFDIEGTVTMQTAKGEIYQPINMELVSGQLKKFRMTQTQWNTEVAKSMAEIGLTDPEPPKGKGSKAKSKADKESAEDTNADASDILFTVKRKAGNPVDVIEVTKTELVGRVEGIGVMTFGRNLGFDTKTLTAYATPGADKDYAVRLTAKQIEKAIK